jgi:predicted Ser/Thr protein kinase
MTPGTAGGLCAHCVMAMNMSPDTHFPGDKPAATQPPLTPAELAPHFPQLEILELLGAGGMGVVYKARQPQLDRLVALKILPAEAGCDPAFAERFTREARALAKLSHPNIVGVYDFGQVDAFYYFLMEYVDGANLRQLERSGNLTPEQALTIVPKICDALQFAHEEGIVHRDIKPENILVDKKGRVKIADFGIAKILAAAGRAGCPQPAESPERTAGTAVPTMTGVIGTPHYMAPEQVEKPANVDHRADIYSLGVVFYEMLTGELPLGRFAPPSEKVQIDVRLDEVVLRALEKEPDRRYQTAAQVKTVVEEIVTTQPSQTTPLEAGQVPLGAGQAEQPTATIGRILRPALGVLGGIALAVVVGLLAIQIADAIKRGALARSPEKPKPVAMSEPQLPQTPEPNPAPPVNFGSIAAATVPQDPNPNAAPVAAPETPRAEPVDLPRLRTQYGKDTLAVETEYAKGIEAMLTAYTNDLQGVRERAQQAGDLDKVKAVLAEVERVRAERTLPIAGLLLPEIKAIVPGYQLHAEQLSLSRTQGLKKAAADYDKALDDLQKKLTQKGKIDEATLVQEARKELEAPAVAAPATISSVVVTVPPAAYHPAWARAVNLIPLIDLDKDGFKGDWKIEHGAFVTSGTCPKGIRGHALLEIPYQPPAEYDFRVVFTPLSGNTDVSQVLTRNGRSCGLFIGALFNKAIGFSLVNDEHVNSRQNPSCVNFDGLRNNQKYISVVSVRNDGVKAYLNGKLVTQLRTPPDVVSPYPYCRLRDDSLLGVGAYLRTVAFHGMEVLEITGKGRVVPRTTVASNVRGVGPTTSTAAASAEAWRLSEWSDRIVLPAGNYRGPDKGVVLNQDCKIVVGPGTLIDGGRFVSADVLSHETRWQVQRSLFRKVELSLCLDARFEANQSVFDECFFSRRSQWNWVLWDTRWSFEDCVFSKRFAFDPLWVRSYSVRAIGCTFYDIELPRITYRTDDKSNPSEQAQSRELRFERCRFVNCVVPESLLASTIDCVFDNCIFTTNENTGLSKASKPIVVNAFIVPGKTKPPQSYTSGKLQVNFKPAGPTQQAGSTLTVTRTGGVLKYAAVSEAGPVLLIGQIAPATVTKTEPPTVTSAASSAHAMIARGKVVEIAANNDEAYEVGSFPSGSAIYLQYIEGKWKDHGRIPTASPDDPLNLGGDNKGGNENRLAIAEVLSSGKQRVLAVVPPNTQTTPFSYVSDHDVGKLVLRINSPRSKFDGNPGSVKYRLYVQKTTGALATSREVPALKAEPTVGLTARAVLSREAMNAAAWALSGLDETVPSDIRERLTYLREDLLDEGKSVTQQVSVATYQRGWELCTALIAALDERDQTRVRAGYRDAQANANTKITSANLEATRTGARLGAFTSGDWPQYERERDQRTEIARQQNNQVALAKQVVLNEWAGRAATLRRGLDESYRRYREALRQDASYR